MKVAVVGLWHLGVVTAACLAKHHQVIAFDSYTESIKNLQAGFAPIFEPGLEELIRQGLSDTKLVFTSIPEKLKNAEVIFITYDTPVDDMDKPDVELVMKNIQSIFPYINNGALLLISSQLPVGSTRKLKTNYLAAYPDKKITFAYIPENLRLGMAIQTFTQAERVIVGFDEIADQAKIEKLFAAFTQQFIWMSIESAEMTKHALNAFLATSVVFINEIASLCEKVGASAKEVEQGLKSEMRIGKKAYLRPGDAIAGGTLIRDVNYLIQMGLEYNQPTSLFSGLLKSNHDHKKWVQRRIVEVMKDLTDKTITLLGLTYKANTNTLRRSTSIETAQWLNAQGAKVIAYDPVINTLPTSLSSYMELASSMTEAISKADAIILGTAWEEFTTLTPEQLLNHALKPIVFDGGGFLFDKLNHDLRIQYYSVGKTA